MRISRFALLWFSFSVGLFRADSLRFLQKIPLVWQDKNRRPNGRFEFHKTPSAFNPHAQRNAFHHRGVRQQSRSFARANRRLRPSPNSNRLWRDLSLGKRQLNGEFGNSRDASVHADGAKSRFPKRVARALRRRNSLRVAMQIWGGARYCCRFRGCGPHSAQTEQGGETAFPISL